MGIVITGASGNLGRSTAELVLDRVPASEVILTTRHPEELSDFAERRAEVRRADFDRPETLVGAFAGGERLLLISTQDLGRRSDQHRAAIEASREAGVRHAIYTSYLNPVEENPAVVTPSHRDTEEALRESGFAWTLLRNGLYAEYQVPAGAQAIAMGRLIHNNGDGKAAYVSREDCAAVAAAVAGSGPDRRRSRGQSLRHHWAAAAGPGRRGGSLERGIRTAGGGHSRRRRGFRTGSCRVRFSRACGPRRRLVRANDTRGFPERDLR